MVYFNMLCCSIELYLFFANEDALPRMVQAIMSGPRRTSRAIKRAKTPGGDIFNDHTSQLVARCELDTRADTICAGRNFRILSTSGGVCDVKGFHDDYEAIKDVPIARVATAYCDGSGITYILVINEALFFGTSMDHSLINPNQICHNGIPVSDNPYDSGRAWASTMRHSFFHSGLKDQLSISNPMSQAMKNWNHANMLSSHVVRLSGTPTRLK